MTCSSVSMALTLITGVEVLEVDLNGKGRLKPQSPLDNASGVVAIERWVG